MENMSITTGHDYGAEVDAAILALADVSVALVSLYPVIALAAGTPAEARSFLEDGMAATGRARSHLNTLRSAFGGNVRWSVRS